MLQNFKPGFVQGIVESHNESHGAAFHLSPAEIHWYGGTDEGLADV